MGHGRACAQQQRQQQQQPAYAAAPGWQMSAAAEVLWWGCAAPPVEWAAYLQGLLNPAAPEPLDPAVAAIILHGSADRKVAITSAIGLSNDSHSCVGLSTL
jgi:hypothetical protein